jgi:hypothetical protein
MPSPVQAPAARGGAGADVGQSPVARGVWVQYTDEAGDPYYHNMETQETTWTVPPCFAEEGGSAASTAVKPVREGAPVSAGGGGGEEAPERILVISAPVLMSQPQLILGAARRDVTVVLFDGSASSPESLLGMVRGAAPRDGQVTMLGFMTQSASHEVRDAEGFAQLELVRGQGGKGDHTSRKSLRADASLRTFWEEVGRLVAADGRIDFLKSSVAASADGRALLAELSGLTGTGTHAEDNLLETSGEQATSRMLCARPSRLAAACLLVGMWACGRAQQCACVRVGGWGRRV